MISKEDQDAIVNQREGTLVISENKGARQQMGVGAILISPCDIRNRGGTSSGAHNADQRKKNDGRELP